jgi:hypothetical protein
LSSYLGGQKTGTLWKSRGDSLLRKYLYTYDPVNRLLSATFSDGTTSNFNMQMGNGSDPNQAYDYNGNIKKMTHWGWANGNAATQIDNLTYQYRNSNYSNKLSSVTDASTTNYNLGDYTDKHPTGIDYCMIRMAI